MADIMVRTLKQRYGDKVERIAVERFERGGD